MQTVYDWVTVILFIALAVAFFRDDDRRPIRVFKFAVAVAAFAIGNQLGNAGQMILAWVVISLGVIYGTLLAIKWA